MSVCLSSLVALRRNYICIAVHWPLSTTTSGSFFSKKKISFADYEYKLIMVLGMASIESVKMQSRVGDKGGIDCIIGMGWLVVGGCNVTVGVSFIVAEKSAFCINCM